MPAYIHRIATRLPEHIYTQEYARDYLKNFAGDVKTRRLIHAIYNRSGIEKRHSVCGDFLPDAEPELFKPGADGAPPNTSTGARNRFYAKAARKLAVDVVRDALEADDAHSAHDVTHLIFVSCTGFANPGPDYHIIRELGLNENVERYTLGFMGCYAAFPGLRMAAQICEANPRAVVLVVCLELCTLHMQVDARPDNVLANSLFADGAACAIISAREPTIKQPAYRLDKFVSGLLLSGEADMAWEIGDHGFNIVLSSYVPDLIGANIGTLMERILSEQMLSSFDIEEWAVHPGGRSILDEVEHGLELAPGVLERSRRVLRDCGNMSSATILFVLKQLLETASTESALTCAMAFGPGLTVETALLERIGGPQCLSRDTREFSLLFQSQPSTESST
jgi:predicted naringenin-chalcone synthase